VCDHVRFDAREGGSCDCISLDLIAIDEQHGKKGLTRASSKLWVRLCLAVLATEAA